MGRCMPNVRTARRGSKILLDFGYVLKCLFTILVLAASDYETSKDNLKM